MQGRIRTLTTFKTGDPVQDRFQEHVKQTLQPVLDNPLLSAADFRFAEVQGADSSKAPTFVLQYRSTGTTWTTIWTSDSTGQIAQPAWTAPTLVNSYTAPRAVGYFKDSFGIIHLRGTVTGGLADLIFTLPSGFRPSQLWIFSTDHNGAFGRVLVDTDGTVKSDLTLHTNVVLDGITYDTRA